MENWKKYKLFCCDIFHIASGNQNEVQRNKGQTFYTVIIRTESLDTDIPLTFNRVALHIQKNNN